ncbi:predicted protein [Chaetoceros tenuissimus]|uniref:Uncharacterized protein n=1 Tax=Chaetoceros tenuissimus TaxID=426638 RepID=A0AAD3D6X3_9STRA|nr:predicted protein [Chaetoceros tenuissimus]
MSKRIGGCYGVSASGLNCTWGSDLDTQVQRQKNPRTALPEGLRKKLGFKKRTVLGREATSMDEISNSVSKVKIEKKQYLKKGSGLTKEAHVPLKMNSLRF